MYDPDVSPDIRSRVCVMNDRQAVIDKLRKDVYDKLGYGVTVVGDRLTFRWQNEDEEIVSIHMAVLEVMLPRDVYVPDNK